MKRKLPSAEKGKGIQSITKFFKSLTSQGPKRSSSSDDNSVRMKTAKETEFRTPLFEKLRAAETSSISKDSNSILSPDNSAKNDKENGHNSVIKALLNDQSKPSVPGHDEAAYGGPQAIGKCKTPRHSSPASCQRTLDNIDSPAFEKDQGESSAMDCDETSHSVHEESDALCETCCESFTSVSCNPVHDESENMNLSNREVKPDFNLSGNKESGLSVCLDTKLTSEDLPKEENSCHVDVKEKEHDRVCDEELTGNIEKISTPSAVLKDVESLGYINEEFKTSRLNQDQNSSCDDLMNGEQKYGCDSSKEEECNKYSEQNNKPNSANAEESDSSDDHREAELGGSCGDCKEGELDEDFDQMDKPLNDIHLHRDSNDGGITEDSDSSDEDLLTPPVFLSEKLKLKPNVETPEKGVAPDYSTPSPITKDVEREDRTKYKLSFDKLIKEKVKRREKDAELAEMEEELQRGLEKGGIGQMHVPSTFSDIESEEELTDDGRDLKDCTLPKDIKKFLVDVHDFSEELSGEDIFPMFHPYVTSQDFPHLSMVPHPASDTFESKLFTASDSDLQELLCGGWILQHYLDRPCPPEVADWLFQIMCRHSDQHIISSSFQVLWALVEVATESRADLPQTPRGSLWVPSIKRIIREILSFGATLPRLYPGDLVDQLNIKEILSVEISSGEIQMEDVTASSSPQTECFPVVNIMHLVQFLTHCLQKCPRSFTVQDLRNLVVLLCQFALDVRLQMVVFDVEMCIAAVLNCYGEMQWPDEMKELCRIVTKLSTNHRNLLHLVQIQPPSFQGVQLQRHLSVTLLEWLVLKFCKQELTGKSHKDERCQASVPDDIEVSNLVKIVERIKPGEESDYYLLHTIISLVNLAVGNEDLSPKERGSLETLTNKLRTLNGDIKDPRAAFMNRTKVKDLLVRTILRLAYMTQCIKPSREQHITSYFEWSSSGYEVELLKETENGNGEELSGNEERESSTRQEMDCSTSN